jgi:hypothetical protein
LIKRFSKRGDWVLDLCAGTGWWKKRKNITHTLSWFFFF